MNKISLVIILLSLFITGCTFKFNVKEEVKKAEDGTISKDITITVNPEEVDKLIYELGSDVNNLNTDNRLTTDDKATLNNKIKWYAIKITGGKVYYGQIENLTANPILLMNWFTNYDQYLNTKNNTGNLRLISGEQLDARFRQYLAIKRDTIVYMEPLADDSKVLKAILEYKRQETNNNLTDWYMIQTSNKETFFGQIINIKNNPIILNGFYYNYDKSGTNIAGNLRLVKSSKQKIILQKDIVFIQSLKIDSKIVQSILENEKK